MHLVDALAKMQLTASSKSAECVPFSHNNVKMTLLKGPDALAARRAVASNGVRRCDDSHSGSKISVFISESACRSLAPS